MNDLRTRGSRCASRFVTEWREHLPRICDIFGVAAGAGLVIVDSRSDGNCWITRGTSVSSTSGSEESCSTQRVEIDVEGGRAMKFKLANGTTTCGDPLVQTPHGCLRHRINRSPTDVLSIKGLRLLHTSVDFAVNTMAYRCVNCLNEAFAIERRLATSPKGQLWWDPSGAKTDGRF